MAERKDLGDEMGAIDRKRRARSFFFHDTLSLRRGMICMRSCIPLPERMILANSVRIPATRTCRMACT